MSVLAIGGIPRSGKTVLAGRLRDVFEVEVMHTDDLVGQCAWSEASEIVSDWFETSEDRIIEGVAVGRGLRKWLAKHPAPEKPCEQLTWKGEARLRLSKRQGGMAKVCADVLAEIRPELEARGVRVVLDPEDVLERWAS